MRLDDVRGFVFDVDGTLVHRAGDTAHVVPGARELLERIGRSGRPFVLFTNGSHVPPAAFARGLRDVGLPVEDDQVLTPRLNPPQGWRNFDRKLNQLVAASGKQPFRSASEVCLAGPNYRSDRALAHGLLPSARSFLLPLQSEKSVLGS